MSQQQTSDPAPKKKPDIKAQIAARLHDPLQLRFVIGIGLLLVWYFAGYTRMNARIASTTSQLESDRKRLALAQEVETLRVEEAQFADRLPPRSDPNEFLQFILGGVRSSPLKLNSLIPDKPRDAGPFQVASVKLDVEGRYPDILGLLGWIEKNKRMLRVDSLKFDLDSRDDNLLKVQLTIVGLMGVEKTETPKAKAKTKAEPIARPRPPGTPTPKPAAKS